MAGPLAGLKVLDFSTLLPGPFGTMMLADLGADVLRVVAPSPGDLHPPSQSGEPNPLDQSLARGKRCITVNMKSPESREVIKRLIASHDVLVEQFRPGVMKRLGWGYEEAKAVNPGIIYAALTGYGQDGPYRDRAGHDMNYLALSGLMSYVGRKETGPTTLSTQVADICAGSYNLVVGVLAALFHKGRTGEGQFIDVSMFDGSVALNAVAGPVFLKYGNVPGRETELLSGGTLYDFYRTSDGEYLSVGGLEAKFLADFLDAIGLKELASPGTTMYAISGKAEKKKKIAEVIETKTLAEWCEIFSKRDACVEPVLNLKQMSEHPHTIARELIVEVDNGRGGTVRQLAHPIKYSATPAEYKFTGKVQGADTMDVLNEAGFSADEISALKSKGAIA